MSLAESPLPPREAAGLLVEPRVYACLYFAQQHRRQPAADSPLRR